MRIKILFLLIIIASLFTSCFNDKTEYDYLLLLKIHDNDVKVLKERLKLLKVKEFKIKKENNNYTLYLNKAMLSKDRSKNFFDLLFSNHSYEVYFIDKGFFKEIDKYITSGYEYKIDFNKVLTEPSLTGKDIEKVETVDKDDKEKVRTRIKYRFLSGSRYKKLMYEYKGTKLEIIFLNKMFWSYDDIYSGVNPFYMTLPNNFISKRFQKIGKDYTADDIKNIALFSGYNYEYPVKVVDMKDILLENSN